MTISTKNPNLKKHFSGGGGGGEGGEWGRWVDGRTDEQAKTNLPHQLF